MTARFYNWCVTQFRETSLEDYTENGGGLLVIPKLQFGCVCLEECPETKKLHHHYYLEFTEKVSMKFLKDVMNDKTIHCEARCGSQKQAIDYVEKKETKEGFNVKDNWNLCFYRGDKKHQGNRSDLDSMVDAMEEGYTGKEILMQFRGNALRHINFIYKGLEALHGLNAIDSLIKSCRVNGVREPINESA